MDCYKCKTLLLSNSAKRVASSSSPKSGTALAVGMSQLSHFQRLIAGVGTSDGSGAPPGTPPPLLGRSACSALARRSFPRRGRSAPSWRWNSWIRVKIVTQMTSNKKCNQLCSQKDVFFPYGCFNGFLKELRLCQWLDIFSI